ncbi:hypothetical protein LptCag_1732 [Leptospirillum ferriphilum]|uniref:Uncharacterized protein n=3 Tax=Leptospirillum TaxID=179 RepID=A0A094W599_9BACT|nr:hypothetical protein LFML04_1744 [Leptospirillum ferriphilum ML-04]AKS23174.1 hypothetical protein ABH19_04535 [Leptospirillum sp. Group II 'CF-1']EAY57075.1 MAG: hypothetical protein UBAL2_80490355a [Leptospirillum rubarum]EDZ38286.1 MAG: Hypothetical protein CGL2_11391026 [Leptospirillum sp. Group II '5-way CG']EIJ75624.1 MAG: Hypothetical protein C75L2_00450020 [Leptospirillum sp. Group II 'C75']KGA92588.1 hypothetical protein LptCag_1732 [Leptospirillum ferriphilum]
MDKCPLFGNIELSCFWKDHPVFFPEHRVRVPGLFVSPERFSPGRGLPPLFSDPGHVSLGASGADRIYGPVLATLRES